MTTSTALPCSRTAKAPSRAIRVAIAAMALYVAACSDLPTGPAASSSSMVGYTVTGTAFTDNFDAFDESRWLRSSHWLGRGPLLPSNVELANGSVSLITRSDGLSGAEISSRALYGAGTYTVRARCRVPSGALCAFFMYQTGVGDRADEIDIEIIPGSGQIWFTTWVRGRRTFHSSQPLRFDAAADYHTYSFQRTTTDIRFFVDGALVQIFNNRKKLPQAAMPVFANAWWPTWLTPTSGTGGWDIDYITAS